MTTTVFSRYLRKKEFCSLLGVSRSTLERLVAEKKLPPPLKLGKRTVVWDSQEVATYLSTLPRMEDAYARHGWDGGVS